MCFFNLVEQVYLEQNEAFSALASMIFRKYSFQKQTQFPQGINVLDAANSNTDGFLSRDTCVLVFSSIGLFATNSDFLHLENFELQKYSFQNLSQFPQGSKVLVAPDLTLMVFFGEVHVFLQLC
jgi:hypothetical protein